MAHKGAACYTHNLAEKNRDGAEHFRLVRVQLHYRSRPGRHMVCEVKLFHLSQTPRYSALSYCWRNDDNKHLVEFQGALCGAQSLSHDLTSAMWKIQKQRQNDWLWIDAISIDQGNVAEKNDQVPRMRAIYENAHTVFIWLGDAIPRTRQDSVRYRGNFARNAKLGLTGGKVLQLGKLASTGRVWWSRVWVIQEMVVAVRLYVVIGTHVMTWDKFVEATRELDWYDHLMEFELMAAVNDIDRLDHLRRQWQKQKARGVDLHRLLDIGRDAYATDPRDNIYGLLCLMKREDRERICVDYDRATELLYADMTHLLIRKQQSLDFLVSCFSCKNIDSQTKLPSWVLDFATAHDRGMFRIKGELHVESTEPRTNFRASSDTAPSVTFEAIPLKLRLQAIVFDQVDKCTSVYPYDPLSRVPEAEMKTRILEWLHAAVKMLQASFEIKRVQSDPFATLVKTRDIFKLLSAAKSGFHSSWISGEQEKLVRILAQCGPECEVEDLTTLLGGLSELHMKVVQIRDWDLESLLFTTARGFAGSAEFDKRSIRQWKKTPIAGSARPNDVVVIPLGSSMPWILRSTAAKDEYRLIVDSVIPDIMSGEVMELVKSGSVMAQEITLV